MKDKIYITGDCHRWFDKIFDFCENNETTTDDIMIIAGDAGINYYLDSSDKKVKKKLSKLPITLVILHGNHEERAWNCKGYIHDTYKVGSNNIIAWAEPEFPNLLFLDDFRIASFNNKRFLFIGGAYSVDKHYRQMMGYKWFKSEQIIEADMDLYLLMLKHDRNSWDYSVHKEIEHEFDYAVFHTTPLRYEPTEVFLPNIDQSTVDRSTENFLNKVEEIIDCEKIYSGHFHYDKDKGKVRFIYNDIIQLA